MKLYHASSAQLAKDQIVSARVQASYPAVVAEIQARMPSNAISRDIALFCTDSPEWAAVFAKKQGIDAPYIYEVEMDDFEKGPFALIFRIDRSLRNGKPVAHLVAEYINPAADWKFYEYYGPRFRVLSQVEPDPAKVTTLSFSYGTSDYDKADRMAGV